MLKISPSIFAADYTDVTPILKELEKASVDYLHIDVMDGHYVPNLTFGAGFAQKIAPKTNIPLDIHLMIERPEISIDEYIQANPKIITIHYESTLFPIRILEKLREKNIDAAVSINPATSIDSIKHLLNKVDGVLIMSVEPGFYGQAFIDFSMDKIKQLADLKEKYNFWIEVDGGVNVSNIRQLQDIGVDIVVMGAAIFKGNSIYNNIVEIKKVLT